MTTSSKRLLLDAAVLDQIEDGATAYIADALQRWAKALFRGIEPMTTYMIFMRLDDPATRIPLLDALIDVMRDVAYLGVDIGRQHHQLALGMVETKAVNVDPNWDGVNNDVLRWVMSYNYSLGDTLSETVREQLRLELERFVTSGEPMQRLIARLSDPQTGLFSLARARKIAATEVTRAYALGNLEAWKAGGIIERRIWQTVRDRVVCRLCRDMNGQETGLREPFKGPFGPIDIPAHVSCRCDHAPVITVNVPADWQPEYTTATLRFL